MIQNSNQSITSYKKYQTYRLSNNKNPKTIAKKLEAKLVESGIYRARYHGGDLEGTSIIRLFQNVDNIFKKN